MINPFETKRELVNTSPIVSDAIKNYLLYVCMQMWNKCPFKKWTN